MVFIHAKLARSHRLTRLSVTPAAKYFPSLEKSMQVEMPQCPTRDTATSNGGFK